MPRNLHYRRRPNGVLTLSALDVRGYDSLQLKVLYAVSNDNGARWESTDEFRWEFQMDGGAFTVFGRYIGNGDAIVGGNLQIDADLNGAADPGGDIVSNGAYGEKTFSIPVAGSSLVARLTAQQVGGSEEFAFDNIRILGTLAPNPVIASSTYDGASGELVVTGSGFRAFAGAVNDIDASAFTFTGQGGGTYTLTDTPDVEIASSTSFTLVLSATDLAGVNGLLNKNGTSSADGTTYDLSAVDDWALGAALSADISDGSGNGITVDNAVVPVGVSGAEID